MNEEKFQALLPFIVTDLIQKIILQKKISQSEALSWLYGSQLYFYLDNERTKVWHYSTEKLYHLFEDELNTGKLKIPEV